MSIHKLSAGSGYDYLTRQVAALDATAKGHVGLASYYTERGETPGAWIGSGMASIDGLSAGDAVTAEQMRALFGAGMHPLAATRLEQLDAHEGPQVADVQLRLLHRDDVPAPVELPPVRLPTSCRAGEDQRLNGLDPGRTAITDHLFAPRPTAANVDNGTSGRTGPASQISWRTTDAHRPAEQTGPPVAIPPYCCTVDNGSH